MKPLYDLSSRWENLLLSHLSRFIFICLTALLIVLLSYPKIIYAAQVTLEWDAVFHPLLEGYVVYYGTSSGDYDVSLDVGNWTSCTIADLEEGETYYFAVTAYSTEGEESDFSNEVRWPSATSTQDYYDPGIGGGCFIATADYGASMKPHVKVLREFRGRILLSNSVGKTFGELYYKYSLPMADYIAKNKMIRSAGRWSLLPLVVLSSLALRVGFIPALMLMILLLACMGVTGIICTRKFMSRGVKSA